MRYRFVKWVKPKPDMTKVNAEYRKQLYEENITLLQLGAWMGITASTVSWWLSMPLTEKRRRRIEAALQAIRKQREGS